MPRPHPPRKHSRRRAPANQRAAARADAALTRQTADSTTPKTPAQRPQSGGKAVTAEVITAPGDEMWSRRSYAILMACIFGVQVVLGLLLFLLAPETPTKKDGSLLLILV